MKLITGIAILLVAVTVTALPNADEVVPEVVEYDAHKEAQAEITLLLQSGKDEGACKNLAESTLKEITASVDTAQKAVDSVGTGARCVTEGHEAVEAAETALRNAKKARDDAAKALSKAQGQSVQIAPVPLDAIGEEKCQYAFTDSAYTKAKADVDGAANALEKAKGGVTAAEGALDAAQDAQKAAIKSCQCGVRAKYDEVWAAANKDTEENEKAYSKAKHMECVLNGETNCEVGDVPAVKPLKLADGVPDEPCPKIEDVKLGLKNPKQSSDYHGTPPSRAIDGNTRQDWGGSSCTHTMNWGHPWWNVEFEGGAKSVSQVKVWNRSDCCQNRLSGAAVYVKNLGEDHQKCGHLSSSQAVQTVDCKGLTGTSLSINLEKTDYLTLCEVQAFGHTPYGGSKWVTCQVSIDNRLDYVNYNGKAVTVHGCNKDCSNWGSNKKFTFQATGNGLLEIGGANYEANSCATGAFAITCSSEDSFWNGFTAASKHITGATGNSANAAYAAKQGALCAANGGSNVGSKKVWGSEGAKYVKFNMGPSVNA